MPPRLHRTTVTALLSAILLTGCARGPLRLQYLWHNDPELSYYVDKASSIEFPTGLEHVEPPDNDLFTPPRSLKSLEDGTPREVTLNECIRMALQTTAVIRDDQSFGLPGNPILSRPNTVPSTLDPAIQQTGFLFGNRGVEAALADFDALFTSSLQWGRDEVPQNSATLGLTAGQTQTTETAAFQSQISKTFPTGANFAVNANINYDGNNRPLATQAFQSSFNGQLQLTFTQPLLQGAGTEFNRIAGPLNQTLTGVSGVTQGVLISRINQDISLTQFEQSVATLVRDVETRYWDLQLFLRLYESEKESFEDLQAFLAQLRGRRAPRLQQGSAEVRILEAKVRLRQSLADVLENEARLRRLCNLPLSDGQFLYPVDQPTEATLEPGWEASLREALAHRVELRRQKWEIKSLELQLKAAQSLTRPQLNLISQYQVNGLGDQLLGSQNLTNDTLLGNLTDGNNTGWSIGFQYSLPLGLRSARLQEENTAFRLRKARVLLREQERDIAFELAGAVLTMQRWSETAADSLPRIKAGKSQVDFADQLIQLEQATDVNPQLYENRLNEVLRLRDAEQAYLQSILEYNKSIAEFRHRKGMTLVDNEIYLAEGDWHPAAQPFAQQRAISRTYAKDKPRLQTKPGHFVGGPAASAWESLGVNARPSTPGALDAWGNQTGEPATVLIPEIPPAPEESGLTNPLQPDASDPVPVLPNDDANPPKRRPDSNPPPVGPVDPVPEIITRQAPNQSLRVGQLLIPPPK